MAQIPAQLIGVTAPIAGEWYGHTKINAKLMACGFPGEPPAGNRIDKIRVWLMRGNAQMTDPLSAFGQFIADMMDHEREPYVRHSWDGTPPVVEPDFRQPIYDALAREGLSYSRGGHIHGVSLPGPSKSLREQLNLNPFQTIEKEFDRALRTVVSDPPAAITAACAVLEALCKNYLNEEEQEGPNKQLLNTMFPLVMKHLGLSPADYQGDIQQILTGMFSVTHGVAALRTHYGSAHGHDEDTQPIYPRHARLAVNAAHTLTLFIMETWEANKSGRK
ncbi:abortive infection family protein [Bradyrhizobium diazoefficiens]|uniref:abortive infection family protein n=1 Tax=Bradyrhizobium diazoefficiens TaxID=1355477 RepID=UPI00272CE4C8|nr:abortive infection family protein [Bradyrhizobium diazoefficiens]WLA69443.1 abortive infection family protein [Bradyrhizobium diazoefficiens]